MLVNVVMGGVLYVLCRVFYEVYRASVSIRRVNHICLASFMLLLKAEDIYE